MKILVEGSESEYEGAEFGGSRFDMDRSRGNSSALGTDIEMIKTEKTPEERQAAFDKRRQRKEHEMVDWSSSEDEENIDPKRRLSGKSRKDKKRILDALEDAKQGEIQQNYRMQREQLRHDAEMARVKMAERMHGEEMLENMHATSMSVADKKETEISFTTKDKVDVVVKKVEVPREENDNQLLTMGNKVTDKPPETADTALAPVKQ